METEEADVYALRKIDVTQSPSPILKQYKIRSIPYLIIYDKDGTLMARGVAPRLLKTAPTSIADVVKKAFSK